MPATHGRACVIVAPVLPIHTQRHSFLLWASPTAKRHAWVHAPGGVENLPFEERACPTLELDLPGLEDMHAHHPHAVKDLWGRNTWRVCWVVMKKGGPTNTALSYGHSPRGTQDGRLTFTRTDLLNTCLASKDSITASIHSCRSSCATILVQRSHKTGIGRF